MGRVQKIVIDAIKKHLSQVQYTPEDVNTWCTRIVDDCLKDCAKMGKLFKYVATCVIMQRSGAGLHTALSVFWDTKTDGCTSSHVVLKDMDVIVTVYATMIRSNSMGTNLIHSLSSFVGEFLYKS